MNFSHTICLFFIENQGQFYQKWPKSLLQWVLPENPKSKTAPNSTSAYPEEQPKKIKGGTLTRRKGHTPGRIKLISLIFHQTYNLQEQIHVGQRLFLLYPLLTSITFDNYQTLLRLAVFLLFYQMNEANSTTYHECIQTFRWVQFSTDSAIQCMHLQ